MRHHHLASSLLRRLNRRSNLLMVGLVGGMFCLFRVLTHPFQPDLSELLLPFVLLLAHLALAPLPWQWTGDDAARADLGRGCLQALVFNALWVALVLGCMQAFGPGSPPPPPAPFLPPQPPHHPHPLTPSLGLGLLNVAFGLIFGWVTADKEATEARAQVTADQLRRSQAKALQNQLEPHVLFNALNGLSELVREDPLAAEEVIIRLAELYRILMHHGRAAQLDLGQERKLVEAYLAMEQMRLGERLRVEWSWPPWADALLLPPFFLQPLVENAIKHGISPCAEGGALRISCSRHGAWTILAVDNTGLPLAPAPERGVGLGSLEARLSLWTELRGEFKLETREGWTSARVSWIPEVSA